MKSLARAVLNSAAFLELSTDDVLDPRLAVKALEDITTILGSSTAAERAALRAACQEAFVRGLASGAQDAELEFYRSFMKNVGLDEETGA